MSLLGEKLTDTYPPTAAGSHVGGRWVAGTRQLEQILLSISPITGKQSGTVERVERETGRSLTGGLEIYSETELEVTDLETKIEGRWIRFQGRTYETISAAYWPDDGGLACWECYATLMNPQPTLPE